MIIAKKIVAGAIKGGVKAARSGGDARSITKAAVHGAGVPKVGGLVDKGIDKAFDNAPAIGAAAAAAGSAAVGRAQEFANEHMRHRNA